MIFPDIDPIVHIGPWALQWGPLALRWYALAYVAGILLGWRYAVVLARDAKLWGRQTDHPFGMIFCNQTIQAANGGSCPAGPYPRHPSQLYEAALEGAALFAILWLASHKLKWLQRRGAMTGTFLVGYGLFRAALENVRNPDVGMPIFPFGLTMGMMLSTPMFLVGVWLLWKALREPAESHEPA